MFTTCALNGRCGLPCTSRFQAEVQKGGGSMAMSCWRSFSSRGGAVRDRRQPRGAEMPRPVSTLPLLFPRPHATHRTHRQDSSSFTYATFATQGFIGYR